MPGCTSMPSVDVAASPECAMLISVTSRHHLYVCIEHDVFGHSTSTRQSKRSSEMTTRPSPENFA